MKRLALAVILAAHVAASAPALADDPASAETLFNEGRRLMQSEDYARACPMLLESQRLDPGLGTQFNLADCYEHQGKTASAWALFVEVAAATKALGQTARERAARERADALAPKLSHLVIAVPTNHARGLVVKKDGVVVGSMQWGIAIPVDPGSHVIQMTAPGRTPWESSIVVLPDGLTMALPVPNLDMADGSAPPFDEGDATRGAYGESDRPRPGSGRDAGGSLGTQATVAVTLGGVGAIGLAIGSVAGLVSISKHNQSANGCIENECTAAAGAERNGAISAGNWSTAGFAVGAIAGAAAVILWVTRPTPAKPSSTTTGVALTPLLGGAAVVGRW
jgi:hypothetical protein